MRDEIPIRLHTILCDAISQQASDVHLVNGIPPTMRINGSLEVMSYDKLTVSRTKQLIYEYLSSDDIQKFEQERELNISFCIEELSYFRMNIYHRLGAIEAAIRIIPIKISDLQTLGLPPIVGELTKKPNGMILIAGPTGMGKSTTMTAMIDLINHDQRRSRVITIEDPIEHVHIPYNSVIIQREVGKDTKSFSEGLRQALRQDPNWICIGEMRDLETINIALTAAETGHLVLATIHSPDAVITLNRVINVFPQEQQELVKQQLSGVIQGIISQRLIPRIDQPGRVLALEILIANTAVRNILRSGDVKQLYGVIATSNQEGMIGLDRSLASLYIQGIISYETALNNARDTKEFKSFINK